MAPRKEYALPTQRNDLKKTRCPPQGSGERGVFARLFTSCQSKHASGPGASCRGAARRQPPSPALVCRRLLLSIVPAAGAGTARATPRGHPLPPREPWGSSPKSVSWLSRLVTGGEGQRERQREREREREEREGRGGGPLEACVGHGGVSRGRREGPLQPPGWLKQGCLTCTVNSAKSLVSHVGPNPHPAFPSPESS